MSGRLYGIGVGPGDPELITLKALRCIKESDIILLPSSPREDCYAYRIVKQVYPEIVKKEIRETVFPMTKDKDRLEKRHDEIYQEIENCLDRGKTVAFLTIGDPCIYSTYSSIHKRAVQSGREAFYVNGVPSFCAAAARAGVSLAEAGQMLHIIPASYEETDSCNGSGTRVYMKAGKKQMELKQKLSEEEKRKPLRVYTVSDCGMETEKLTYGAGQIEETAGYLSLVIVKPNTPQE